MIGQQNKFGLAERDVDTIIAILKKHPEITLVHLFGSRANGNFKPGSDIDIALMNKGIPDKIISRLVSDFEESTLPYFVDVINYQTIQNADIKEHIDRVGQVFYTI